MSLRVRFAPSPTGYLHIGGARTALFNWLLARKKGGTFILRIEDTDQERSTQDSVDAILESFEWLDLNYDEGPFYQTKRMDRYQEVVDLLLKSGLAYRCTCSKERLEKLREEQKAKKQKPRYDGHCRDKHIKALKTKDYVVRFKNPTDGDVTFDDLVHGTIKVSNKELDDFIIARSDGTPTYNFTVVVDDMDMKITQVIRGDDHINNTPRQLNLFEALKAKPPKYAHLPMILGSDGKRLSKRHGAVSVMQYRDDGFVPQALLNYLVRLGWSLGDQEVLSMAEMIEHFDIKKVNKSAASFNPDKLLWLNQQYIKTMPAGDLAQHLAWHFNEQKIDTSNGPALTDLVEAFRDRAKTLKEIPESARFFYEEIQLTEEFLEEHIKPSNLNALIRVRQGLERLDEWTSESIHNVLMVTAEILDLKLGKVALPIRYITTGTPKSPALGITLQLLGKESVLKRIDHALEYLNSLAEADEKK